MEGDRRVKKRGVPKKYMNGQLLCPPRSPQGRGNFEILALDWLLQPALLDPASSSCGYTFSSNFCVTMVLGCHGGTFFLSFFLGFRRPDQSPD